MFFCLLHSKFLNFHVNILNILGINCHFVFVMLGCTDYFFSIDTFQLVCDCFISVNMENYTGCKLGSLLAKEKCAGYVLRSKGQPWSTSSVCSRTRGACCYWCPWHHPPSIPIKSLRYGPVFSMSDTMDFKWLVLNWTVNMIDQEYFVIILFLCRCLDDDTSELPNKIMHMLVNLTSFCPLSQCNCLLMLMNIHPIIECRGNVSNGSWPSLKAWWILDFVWPPN